RSRPCVLASPTRRSSDLIAEQVRRRGIGDGPARRHRGIVQPDGQESRAARQPERLALLLRHLAGGHPEQSASRLLWVTTGEVPEDRKSTRLNSSHVKSSY